VAVAGTLRVAISVAEPVKEVDDGVLHDDFDGPPAQLIYSVPERPEEDANDNV